MNKAQYLNKRFIQEKTKLEMSPENSTCQSVHVV